MTHIVMTTGATFGVFVACFERVRSILDHDGSLAHHIARHKVLSVGGSRQKDGVQLQLSLATIHREYFDSYFLPQNIGIFEIILDSYYVLQGMLRWPLGQHISLDRSSIVLLLERTRAFSCCKGNVVLESTRSCHILSWESARS
jgi:hypothetical protein